ncbi:MAG: LysM peptidoglycan-binding domain-containing protein [Planctomycetes bacterium]|nr:LysM peptidoglycan-binding domain-containing protein [Planctomycetota bacterium]
MSRAKKLLIVSFVLALGVGLAWPFRKSATMFAPAKHTDVPGATVSASVTFKNQPIASSLGAVDSTPALGRHVVAKMASTAENVSTAPSRTGFDLESQPSDGPSRTARPAYSKNPSYSTTADDAAWPEEIVHIVHNGDTLEKLAERYLGDAGRALELFDLNRDQLANPHLLPIGAELRIPIPPRRELD